MLSPKSHAFLNSSYGNLATQRHHAGAQKVVINPGDAAARAIVAGDMVRVFNDRGAFEAEAELSADAMAGVVVAPMGYWPRHSRGRRTVNAITPPTFADYGNAPTFSDTLVEVAKATPSPTDGFSYGLSAPQQPSRQLPCMFIVAQGLAPRRKCADNLARAAPGGFPPAGRS